jgi:hypothetical protein
MDIDDLGPLERAALRAFAQAELISSPLTIASLWRSLPGYKTSLANVRAALDVGAPLRSFVSMEKDSFALHDRSDLLRGMARRQGWSDARWRQLRGPLRGLGKLPWVEAIGVTGTMSWGLLDTEDSPCELVLIAEGGRAPLARAAARLWRKAAGLQRAIRFAAVLDADDLRVPDGGTTAAWWLLAVRPVVNEAAFERLWAANPWAGARFPSFEADGSGGLPEYFVGDRLDGRLAAVRRAAVATGDDGVLLRSEGRREGTVEARLGEALAGTWAARPCEEWVRDGALDVLVGTDLHDGDARVEARWAEVRGWPVGSPATVGAGGEPAAPEPEAEDVSASAADTVDEASPGPRPERARAVRRASRRTRGPRLQRRTATRVRRARAPGASQEGQGPRR